MIAGRIKCSECGDEHELTVPIFVCHSCGGRADVIAGEEFEVESIDVEEEEAECIAPR